MKNKLSSLLALTVFITGTISCDKQVNQNCIQAKIIRTTCAGMVMQSLNNNSVGEDNWSDIFNGNALYHNVFSVSNSCRITPVYKTGDTLYITVGTPVSNNCIHCALYDAPPKTSYDVTSMGKLSCSDTLK